MGYASTKFPYILVKSDTSAPAGRHLILTSIAGMKMGDEARVLASFASTSDLLFAQLEFRDGHGYLSLWERVDDTNRPLCAPERVPGVNIGEWVTLAICCADQKIAAMASVAPGQAVRCRGESAVCGEYFGFGSGKVAEEVRFDHIRAKFHQPMKCDEHPLARHPGCPNCGEACPCCEVDFRIN